ncbi:MAG: hypothetical protein AB2A00_33540, partial [Myxococcota bacterium]
MLVATGACSFTVELGEAPVPPPQRIDGCTALTPGGPLELGAQVVGRPVYRTVVVRNCVDAQRPFVPRVQGDRDTWMVFDDEGAAAVERALYPGEEISLTVQFLAPRAGDVVATLWAEFPDEQVPLVMTGTGREGPDLTPRLDCSVDARVVPSSLVLGPETDPQHPETSLALHGVQPGECFEVTGDVVILGTPLLDLDVLGGLRRVGGRLLIGHELGGNQALQQVDALANLVQVGGELVIRDNPALRTVDGLLNLAQVGA